MTDTTITRDAFEPPAKADDGEAPSPRRPAWYADPQALF